MLNNITILGRMVADPELRVTRNGKSVASFRIANTTGYGENEHTNWLSCTAWGKTGEIVKKYFKKGHRILITGRVETREYEDKSGNKRVATEIVVNEVDFIEKSEQKESGIDPKPVSSSEGFISIDDVSLDSDENLPF